jgi:hypothetical protein
MPGTGSPDPAVRRLAEAPKLDPQQVPPAPIPGAVAKNEALYVILGLLIPGLPALLLKDDKATGGIQLGLWVVSWILAIFLIGFVLWIGVAIWSAMDGYQAAKLWNSRHGFAPDQTENAAPPHRVKARAVTRNLGRASRQVTADAAEAHI